MNNGSLSAQAVSRNNRRLTAITESRSFTTAPAPCLVLDRDLRIRGINKAFASATHTNAEKLREVSLVEVLSNTYCHLGADAATELMDSLQRALRTGRPHHMGVQRCGLPHPDQSGQLLEKVWLAVNVPLRDDHGGTIGVLHQVDDITDLVLFEHQHGNGKPAGPSTAAARTRRTLRLLHEANRDALIERRELINAMRTRSVIELAKGILIGQRGCGPEEAFNVLVKLSQDTNTKLHTVAQALVHDSVPAPPPLSTSARAPRGVSHK